MENKLQLVEGLSESKSAELLDDFGDFFELAEEWKLKAKTIVVTSAFQLSDMKRAREGRFFLRDKRIDVERKRKELKAEYLEAGRAIDRIAKTLTGLIEPIEEYLEKQEKFVEILAKQEEKRLADIEAARLEQERIAKEKAEEDARVAMKLENDRLRKEADDRERAFAKERNDREVEASRIAAAASREAIRKEEQAKREAKIVRDNAADEIDRQKKDSERIIREQKERADAELKRVEDEKRNAEIAAQKKLDEVSSVSEDAIETLKIIQCELSIMADKFADTDHDHSMWLRVASINVCHVITMLTK
jgi:hypothetical protein